MIAPGQDSQTLTELDHARLQALLRRNAAAPLPTEALADLLDNAELVPSRGVGPDVVTMYSQALLADPVDGRRFKVALCYPADADAEAGFVSVLSPLGAGLLGRRVGETAQWRTPDGGQRSAEVVALLYQPEASGDYTL